MNDEKVKTDLPTDDDFEAEQNIELQKYLDKLLKKQNTKKEELAADPKLADALKLLIKNTELALKDDTPVQDTDWGEFRKNGAEVKAAIKMLREAKIIDDPSARTKKIVSLPARKAVQSMYIQKKGEN